MSACAYPDLEEHRGEHRDFVQRIQELTRQFDADPESTADIVNQDLLAYLRDWLNHHIMIEDKAYCPHIENKPAAKNAAKSFQGTQIWWSG